MTLEQYNQIIQDIDKQINALEQNKKDFIGMNEKKLTILIDKRQKEARKWFVSNFEVIWANRHLFGENTPHGDIIVDCFEVYTNNLSGLGSNIVSKIKISDLLSLWNMGFKYRGYPIVELVKHRFKSKLSYIKEGKLESLSGFDVDDMGFSPLLMGVLDYLSKHQLKIGKFDMYKSVMDMKNLLMQ